MSADPGSNAHDAGPQPARILVVEDNDALREAIVMALGEQWSSVIEVSDGQSAIEMISDSEPFDVVLCDLRLPGPDGTQIQRATQQRDSRTAFVLMPAFATVANAIAAIQRGAFDFIQKPFDLEELVHQGKVESAPVSPDGRKLIVAYELPYGRARLSVRDGTLG